MGDNKNKIEAEEGKLECNKKPYKCNELKCNAAFSRPGRLRDHQFKHKGEHPYKCHHAYCNKSYTTQSHLKRHLNVSHSQGPVKDMLFCKETDCGKVFANKYSLKKHSRRYHCPDSLPFKCSECDKGFKRKSLLHSHMLVHGKEAPYKCDKCAFVFVQYHLYQKHLKNHKTYQCDCNRTFTRWTKLCEHKKQECPVKQQQHKCIICDKVFSQKQHLTQHSLLHVEDSQQETFKCPYLDCNRNYKYKKNLQFHIKTFHQQYFQKIICPKEACNTVFKSNKNLKQHLRTVHNGLSRKERKPRKFRSDKGTIKKDFAAFISGFDIDKHTGTIHDDLETNNFQENNVVLDVTDMCGDGENSRTSINNIVILNIKNVNCTISNTVNQTNESVVNNSELFICDK